MAKTSLKIVTALGQQQETHDKGPLLLAGVQGIEGISMPYSYDATLFQSLHSPDIDPSKLINTPAVFGMRGNGDDYTYRCGIIQTFEKDSTNEQNWDDGWQTEFRAFKAHLVPAFKMLDYEMRYRVFEEMTVLDIMEEAMGGFSKLLNFSTYVKADLLRDEKFAKIPYCVQFGESTLSFLSRLMSQFDIWYIFEHPQTFTAAARETMVLGASTAKVRPCSAPDMDVVYTAPERTEIAGFQRVFVPARKRIWISDFNLLDPVSIPCGSSNVAGTYDMFPR
ncbi:MAG TPA: phage late control D family protein, partial [Acetobacteraceae bacterium]|nr:phage late control D family protein [Acetobacteraceae bacterium]